MIGVKLPIRQEEFRVARHFAQKNDNPVRHIFLAKTDQVS